MSHTLFILITTLLRVRVALTGALLLACLAASPAKAADCNLASAQGATGPANWQTYCWLDLTSFNNTTARSAAGQNFSYTLPDGTVMAFTMRVSGPALTSAAAPSWSGAAVGNTAFLGITGRPILYQGDAGTSVITISNINLTPPPGSGGISAYMFVAADAESSNEGESLQFQTNGTAWSLLDRAGPTSGSTYPELSGAGTTTVNVTGASGTVGAHIVGSATPTQVTARMVGGGLQGVMFAVRFASIRLNLQIDGPRVNAADQFRFNVSATSGGTVLASGTSTGSGSGPFTAASLTTASALPVTLSQTMASGSVSALGQYRSVLSCTNATTSATALPNGLITASYNFGALQFGDNIQCTFVNTAHPHLRLSKALGSGGRRFNSDQFTMEIAQGATVNATTTTSGTGSTVSNGSTSLFQATAGLTYTLREQGAGATALAQYAGSMVCTNANGSSPTVLPSTTGGTVTVRMGDIISCIITNTRRANNATLSVVKTSSLLSDPVSGASNPFAVPGAIVRYTFEIANSGNLQVDNHAVEIIDALPPGIEVGTAINPSFTAGTSALTFNSTNVRFSNAAAPPATYAACNYTPTGAYDPAVRYLCFNPRGRMAARSSGSAAPTFILSFEGRIR